MTSEEIKQQFSMRDIVSRYGIVPNRAGFASCPFHSGDRTASMKIYPKDFHCFGCGANGDIFKFVMMMDNLSFREAFESLGGAYEKPSFESRRKVYEAQKAREQRQKEEDRKQAVIHRNTQLLSTAWKLLDNLEPMSEEWADVYNYLQYKIYEHGELHGIPY